MNEWSRGAVGDTAAPPAGHETELDSRAQDVIHRRRLVYISVGRTQPVRQKSNCFRWEWIQRRRRYIWRLYRWISDQFRTRF